MNTKNLNMLHSLKPFLCPQCKAPYSAKDTARFHNVNKFPRILTCGHSVCESCLQTAEKQKKDYACPVCKELVDLSNGDFIENFLPDAHALGVLSANMKNSLPSFKMKVVNKRNQDCMKSPESSIFCGKCNQEQALWQCGDCELNFCGLCFKEDHKEKSKKKHEGKKIFAELYSSLVQAGCPEHENRAIEFFCEVDSQLTCSYCMLMGDHVGHQVKTLFDKNKSCVEDLKTALVDITTMQKQLKYTDHLLSEKIPNEKVDITDTIKNVHDLFHTLHASLQLREAELITQLTSISQQNTKPLEEMRLKIANFERELVSVKKDMESVIENPCLAISAPAILKKIKDNQHFPCYLVPLPGEENKTFSVGVNFDGNLEKLIKDFGEIYFDGRARFALLPDNDLPEDFSTEIPESFSCKIQSSLDTESCSETVSNFSEDSLNIDSTNKAYNNLQASLKYKDFNQTQPEKVIVSHIINPSSFYIQRYNNLRKLNQMSDNIDKWCKSYESKSSKVIEVEKGDLYLVRYALDNKWYRGRVKSIIKDDDKGAGNGLEKVLTKDKDEVVEVFFIDYGNTEITFMSHMKNIQAKFLNLPGMAKHCCLSDILPATGNNWSPESIESFTMFVRERTVIMQVFEERNNILNVDLSQVADDIYNDVPASIKEALVFLELAVFENTTNKTKKRVKKERDCMPPESLCVNANISAMVSHVESPSHFYVQQMSTASYLATLIHDMTETYSKELNTMLHGIYVPRIGMICAALYVVDQQWYRARVIDLPGGAQVKVQYVDFGNTAVLHHKNLRKLFDKFFKLNIQAIPCKLAHVTYNQNLGWSPEAGKWLTDTCSRQRLTLKSLGIVPGEKNPEVVLYMNKKDSEISVNALMVEEGLAKSTGIYSKTVRKTIPKKSPKQKLVPTNTVISLQDMAAAAIPAPIPIQNVSSNIEEEYPSAEYLPPETESSHSPSRKYPSLAPPPISEGMACLEVIVSHVDTPGSFYTQIVSKKKELNELIKSMQHYYENANENSEGVEYSIGNACAVYCKSKKKWLRGTMTSISEEEIEIHYNDFGNKETFDKKDIRKLLKEFWAHESFSVRCHLDGIIPAGGSQKWPHTACDRFLQMVTPHDILLLANKGDKNEETNSLPVDLLIDQLVVGGALEPTKIKRISMTEELISKGMALPTRRRETRSITPKPEEVSETKTFEDQNNFSPTITETFDLCNASKKKLCNVLNNTGCTDMSNVFPREIAINRVISKSSIEDNLTPPANPTFHWKPCVPPVETTFKGFVTNIGDDGTIHLYVVQSETSQVDTIKRSLQYKYSQSNSDYVCLKEAPAIGEACMAKFSIDKQWYRAEVLAVYPGKVKVNFVDYGNNEIVPLSDIRLDIIMKGFARLCQECVLHDIANDGSLKCDNELLTFLHSQLVETIVDVEIVAPPDPKGRLQTRITTSTGIDVSELLMNMGFSESNEVEVTQSSPEYPRFPMSLELKAGEVFPACVTQIFSSIVCLQISKISDPKDYFELKCNEMHEKFLELSLELMERAECFPKITNPMPGMNCCAKYSYDNTWYRCEILDLTEDGVDVLYIDYGNSEIIACDKLRALESKFFDLPVQVHYCELHGVTPVSGNWDDDLKKSLLESLGSGGDLFAKVMVPGNIPKVELKVKNAEGETKLPYQELIEKKMLLIDHSV